MIEIVRNHLINLQSTICSALETIEQEHLEEGTVAACFSIQNFADERGQARPRVLKDGSIVEKAAVNFTHSIGQHLPPAATLRKPELAGCGFQAVSLSLIIHPRNPHAPTTHANFRFFVAEKDGQATTWWFGGGFDLTPYFPLLEDVVHWHHIAKKACELSGHSVYSNFKEECDRYFYLPHRSECRGVGGLFFDDWNTGDFNDSFALVDQISTHFLEAYLPILRRRMNTPYAPWQRNFQCLRRGRYAEFNLLYDRGTRYGLQSGRRIESVLASMPPIVHWDYPLANLQTPEFRQAESHLLSFLRPRDWLNENISSTRRLIVMRHAKSAWKTGVTDHKRPLNKRGNLDAPLMGSRLASEAPTPQLVLCSDATRTQQTWQHIAATLPASEIRLESSLYHANTTHLEDTICALDDTTNTVMIIGHNPGLQELVLNLTGQSIEMKTATIAICETHSASWSATTVLGSWELIHYWTPDETRSRK